jgi:hypothetical protein
MNAFETIDAILRGHISTRSGATNDNGKMIVQNDAIVTEDDYQLRYIAVYGPEEGIANVEAYVVINEAGVSFYDFDSNEIWVASEFIGVRHDYSTLDEVIVRYNLEAGRNGGYPGAGDAFIQVLKEMG